MVELDKLLALLDLQLLMQVAAEQDLTISTQTAAQVAEATAETVRHKLEQLILAAVVVQLVEIPAGAGGSGVVILRYPKQFYNYIWSWRNGYRVSRKRWL
jgi:hypothetical protein